MLKIFSLTLFIVLSLVAQESSKVIKQEIGKEKTEDINEQQQSPKMNSDEPELREVSVAPKIHTVDTGFNNFQSESSFSEYNPDSTQELVADEIIFFSDYTIDTEQVSVDNIRIVGANLTVAGTVMGKVTIIGGDVFLKNTAVIEGKIIAIGGSINRDEGAIINGKIIETNLKEGLVYREIDQESNIKGASIFGLDKPSERYQKSWIHPEVSPFIYNRNEGLLFSFPEDLSWDHHGQSRFRLSLSAGWRFGQKTFAGKMTLERAFSPDRAFILFGSIFRESRTDDAWRLPEWENSVAMILGRQDFYDRWDETGYETGMGIDFPWLKIKTAYTSVQQDSIPVNSKIWTLFQKDRLLRPNLPVVPGILEAVRVTVALKPRSFDIFHSGMTFYLTGEKSLDNAYTRVMAALNVNWRTRDDFVFRTRFMGGSSKGTLPKFRQFYTGGLGSVSAYPYKIQQGDQFVQVNLEMVLTPEFMDDSDFIIILFADVGHAWNKAEYSYTNTDKIFENGIASAGIGFSFDEDDDGSPRINISRPLDGRDYWETTVRLNFNF